MDNPKQFWNAVLKNFSQARILINHLSILPKLTRTITCEFKIAHALTAFSHLAFNDVTEYSLEIFIF